MNCAKRTTRPKRRSISATIFGRTQPICLHCGHRIRHHPIESHWQTSWSLAVLRCVVCFTMRCCFDMFVIVLLLLCVVLFTSFPCLARYPPSDAVIFPCRATSCTQTLPIDAVVCIPDVLFVYVVLFVSWFASLIVGIDACVGLFHVCLWACRQGVFLS